MTEKTTSSYLNFVLTIFDDDRGPIPTYTTDGLATEQSWNIALKSMVILGSMQTSFDKPIEAIIALPEMERTGFFYFFSLYHPDKRGGAYPISFSLLAPLNQQIQLYRLAEVISKSMGDLQEFFSRIFVVTEEKFNREAFEEKLSEIIEFIAQKIKKGKLIPEITSNEISEEQIDPKIALERLLELDIKNLDQGIFNIITGRPVAILGKQPEDVRSLITALPIFAPNREKFNVVAWVTDEIPEADIFGTNYELLEDLVERRYCRISLHKMKVFGGRSNRFCKALLEEVRNADVSEKYETIENRVNWLMKQVAYVTTLASDPDQRIKLSKITKDLDRDLIYLIHELMERSSTEVASDLEKKIGRAQLRSLIV